MTSGTDEPTTLLERLEEAARRAHDYDVAAKAERERRDSLVVEALDTGVNPDRVAAAAGISRTRAYRILARDDA